MSVAFAVMLVLALLEGLLDAAGIGSARQSLQVTVIAGTLAWLTALAITNHRAR